jgi:hypothetical protein
VLTAALVVVAGRGLVGSLTPSAPAPPPESAYIPLQPPPATRLGPDATASGGSATLATIPPPSPTSSATPTASPKATLGPVLALSVRSFDDPDGGDMDVLTANPTPTPTPKPPPLPAPRQTLTGTATWYTNGTTAMRLPRGTLVKICGSATCVVRRIGDYGPATWTGHIVDLTPQDFRTVCGCGTGTGVIRVKVYVY